MARAAAQVQRCVMSNDEVTHTPGHGRTQDELLKKYDIDQPRISYADPYSRHQQEVKLGDHLLPQVSELAFVAPCATLAGNVEVWQGASVWYRCVIKAETTLVRIGSDSNVQDGTVVEEVPHRLDHDHDGSTIIGHGVTIGHMCRLKACTIEDGAHIGMGSVLNTGSYVEKGAMLGAGTVLAPFQRIPAGQLWVGNPARYLRDVTAEETQFISDMAEHYVRVSKGHQEEFHLPTAFDAYTEAESKGWSIGPREPGSV